MKNCTDLEHSKKLAEILPIESADMWWIALNWQETEYYVEVKQDGISQPKKAIPCWSLAALLSVLPRIDIEKEISSDDTFDYRVKAYIGDGYIGERSDNPVDACVEMIIRLHELQMLSKKDEKQVEQKSADDKVNLVDILKHYPKETELYSPLYGKLWLAEVDSKNGIITCYKHQLDDDDCRAILEQEDTVSFYSDGTTGLPDYTITKECVLFLHKPKQMDIEVNGEDYGIDGLYAAIDILQKTLGKVEGYQTDDGILGHKCAISAVKELYEQHSAWSEEDEPQSQWKPSDEQMDAFNYYLKNDIDNEGVFGHQLVKLYQDLKKLKNG